MLEKLNGEEEGIWELEGGGVEGVLLEVVLELVVWEIAIHLGTVGFVIEELTT